MQAKTNVEKLKNWSNNFKLRSCALLHVFNNDCNINKNQVCALLKFAKNIERQGKCFYYDFTFFNVSDYRMKKSVADDLVSLHNFRTRLWTLFENAGFA